MHLKNAIANTILPVTSGNRSGRIAQILFCRFVLLCCLVKRRIKKGSNNQ